MRYRLDAAPQCVIATASFRYDHSAFNRTHLGTVPERLRRLRFDLRRCLMVREGPAQPAPPPKQPYPAEKARGGEIILNTPGRRVVFIAGLLGAVVVAIIFGLIAGS
jgi:hypothetical protein